MAREYNFKRIEKKWQDIWEKEESFRADSVSAKPKFYALVEFPYPSGAGLHLGHPRPYTAMDVIARKRKMQGYNVLFPIGWDAFGLPTENYAMANKIHPAVVTRENIARFKSQLKALGLSFDWSREVDTTDPGYYKWTQWIFLQMFHWGLAYKKEMAVNFCTSCKVVLANEEVVGGVCERCGSDVVRRVKSQWMLAITKYAQRLIDDLDEVDYVERVKTQQINWIGRSDGAEIRFSTTAGDVIEVFTTRPDTLFGATYMVMSPEHEYIKSWREQIENSAEVSAYQDEAARKSDLERAELGREKTGVELKGVKAVNPATGAAIPIFISDYVLSGYGTGAIMAVPGHDARDYDFARAFSLPVIEVVSGGDISKEAYVDCETGTLVNSGFLNGMSVSDAQSAMTAWLTVNGCGSAKVNYKLRDWVFSRQRFWGEPIPIIHCETCGYVPLDESELPLRLPELEDYEPGDDGESPLSRLTEWVNVPCPRCSRPAKRETDTMPQWAGSSWYFLRYLDPGNADAVADDAVIKNWMPVDWYNGGMEHTTLHLLYSRFWYKFLYDIGVAPNKEPYAKRTSHGMILGEDGHKMSKSRGNVINPDDVVERYGADTMRLYEMFIGDFEKTALWSNESIKGCKRFLERVFGMLDFVVDGEGYSAGLEADFHRTIRKVSGDIEQMKFNTAIAALMTLINRIYEKRSVTVGEYGAFLRLLQPFAPHLCEEIWQMLGCGGRVSSAGWPEYDEDKCGREREIAVQVNGRLRGRLMLADDASEEEAFEGAASVAGVAAELAGKAVRKRFYVAGRIVNFVTD